MRRATIVAVLVGLLVGWWVGTAEAAPYQCRYLNFHRGPAPRMLHVELVCVDQAATLEVGCAGGFRVTKTFRFAPGSTSAERRAILRQEARRFLKVWLRSQGCTVTEGDGDAAVVDADDANP